MEGDQVPVALHQLLQSSNLLVYENALLEQGADDVDQLASLTDDEFKQLCSMIGMDRKPFHIMRLRKVLKKYSDSPRNSNPTIPSSKPVVPSSLDVSTQINTNASQVSLNVSTNQIASPHEPNSAPSLTVDHQLNHEASVKLYLPSFLHPDCESSDFAPLIDCYTPVQRTLGPPPCSPQTWDSKRKSIIKKYAAIYGRNFDKRQKGILSPFEEHVNEAAHQLCLRDPTLLVRRDELFLLSKRAVKEGGYAYCHGVSKTPSAGSSLPSIGQKRSWDSSSSSTVDSTAVSSTSLVDRASNSKHLHLNTSQRLSTKERVNRMYSLQAQIEVNKALQREKITAMEEAKQSGNFSKSFNLQLEVESLGIECQELESVYTLLKRKQARSNRYFRDKTKQQQPSPASDDDYTEAESPPPLLPIMSLAKTVSPPAPNSGSNLKTATSPKTTPPKVMVTVVRGDTKDGVKDSTGESEIKDLVDNVTNATGHLNALIGGEYGKW